MKIDREYFRKLLRLMLPIMLQNFMLAAVAAADALMLGGMDQNTMSAVSLATQIQQLQNGIVNSIVVVTGILGAQYWGKGNLTAIDKVFCISLRLSGIVSMLTFVGCVFFPRVLMTAFTNEPELISIGSEYLKIAGWSYMLTGISQCYLAIMKISDHASQTARISSVTVLLNIALNAVFIYGLFGMEAMGERGAALATVAARVVELTWAICTSFKKNYIRPKLRYLFHFNRVLAKDYAKCLLPLCGSALLWGVGFTSYSSFMGHLGVDAAAANSVCAVVRDLICSICLGVAGGSTIIIGNELGSGNLEKGKAYGHKSVKLAYVVGFLSALLMLVTTPLLLRFVQLTDGAQQLLRGMMLIMSFYMIGRAVNTILINGIFIAGGDTIFDTISLVVCMWCVAVPLAALGTYVFHWSPLVVYACTCIDEVGKLPIVTHHFFRYVWVKDLTRSKNDIGA